MSDNLDDDDLSLDDSFDEFSDKKEGGTLGDLWRDNPMVKIGGIIGGIVVIFLVISMFSGGDDQQQAQSYVGAAPDITSTPGTEEASPAYIEAINEINEADVEDAFETGGSSLPVPIEPPVGVVSMPDEQDEAEDPLQRWRRLQEERLQREIKQRESQVPVDTGGDAARATAIAELADLMSQQMSSILETKSETSVSSMKLTDPDFLENLAKKKAEEAAAEGGYIDEDGEFVEFDDSGEFMADVLLPAGEVEYAQLLTEANTDAPGPVLAEIMSGPLKGSRILGTFEEQNELLTLNFDTIVYKDQSLSIDAVGLDPDTTLAGMATEVDHRYFKRVILPAAAAFVEGFASAIGETQTVTVVVDGGTTVDSSDEPDNTEEVALGIEEAGQEIQEILDDLAEDTEVLVKIHAGTPIGILFLEPVTLDEDVEFADDAGVADTGGL